MQVSTISPKVSTETITHAKAIIRAALILSEPEQETDPELIHELMAAAYQILPSD